MRMNTQIYNSLWFSNGKSMTMMSYVYLVLGAISLTDDITTALMFCVMAELSRVDKATRILCVEQAEAIIYEGDKGEDDGQQ